jgi:hypothetical protein
MRHAGRSVSSIPIERDKIGRVCVNQAKFVSAAAPLLQVPSRTTDDQRQTASARPYPFNVSSTVLVGVFPAAAPLTRLEAMSFRDLPHSTRICS